MATISIADNDARVQYTQAVNGIDNDPSPAATELTIDFPFFDLDDIKVIKTTAAGVDTTLTRGTGTGTFTVTGTSVDDGFSGGNVKVHDTDSATDTVYTILRDIPIVRTTDFPTSGPFNISSLNTELDKVFAIQQELETSLGRALILSESDTLNSITLPSVGQRTNKILSFDANGDATVSSGIGTFQGTDATVTTAAYVKHDLVKSTTTAQLNNVYIALQDSPLGTALTNTTYWALVVDAVSAATSATNAAASATSAGNAQTAAETAQTAAETAETNAQGHEDTAQDWATKVDGEAETGEGYSSKAWAVGGTGVTDTAGAGPAKDWAIDTTSTVDGTEFSSKEYSIGTGANSGMNTGSAKQWALGGGASFDRDTAVTGSGLTAEFSAKYWANQAANSVQDFQDVYYGSFTSDTAAEDYQLNTNQGSVNVGDLYFNSSDNVVKVRTFSGWQDAAADTTSFATNGFSIAMSIAL